MPVSYGICAALAVLTCFFAPAKAEGKTKHVPKWTYLVHPGDKPREWVEAPENQFVLNGLPKGWKCSVSKQSLMGSWDELQRFHRQIECSFQDQKIFTSLSCAIDQRSGERFWRSGYYSAHLALGTVNLYISCE